MALKLGVQSRYKNLLGSPWKTKFADLRISVKPTETWALACSKTHVAFVADSTGGGAVQVLHVGDQIRKPPQLRISGHTAAIQEVAFSPFDDSLLCTSSDDCTVKLWKIPTDKEQWSQNLRDPLTSLTGHKKRIYTVAFNPITDAAIASGSCDGSLIVWNIAQQSAAYTAEHPDFVQGCDWNHVGSLLATTCRDKRLRIVDPRASTVVDSVEAFDGAKAMKVKWIDGAGGVEHHLVATGFGRMGNRYAKVWDTRKFSDCVQSVEIDRQTSFLLLHWDEGAGILYTAGKGESIIRPFTMVNNSKLTALPEFRAAEPHKCLAFAHKRCVDVTKMEIQRCYLATATTITPVSFQVPRKQTADFQEDLFPICMAGTPSVTGDQWFSGVTKTPILVSLNPVDKGKVMKAAKTVNLDSVAPPATASPATAQENAAPASAAAAGKSDSTTAAAAAKQIPEKSPTAAADQIPEKSPTAAADRRPAATVAAALRARDSPPPPSSECTPTGGRRSPPLDTSPPQPKAKTVPVEEIAAAIEPYSYEVEEIDHPKRQAKPKTKTSSSHIMKSFSGSLMSHGSAHYTQHISSETEDAISSSTTAAPDRTTSSTTAAPDRTTSSTTAAPDRTTSSTTAAP
eukprot:Lankesteria_metandrocarpae@DN1531_c0_g1_i1.p1